MTADVAVPEEDIVYPRIHHIRYHAKGKKWNPGAWGICDARRIV